MANNVIDAINMVVPMNPIIASFKDYTVTFTPDANSTLGSLHADFMAKFNLGPYEFSYISLNSISGEIVLGTVGNSYYKLLSDYAYEDNSYKFTIHDTGDTSIFTKDILTDIKSKYIRYLQEIDDEKMAIQLNAEMMQNNYSNSDYVDYNNIINNPPYGYDTIVNSTLLREYIAQSSRIQDSIYNSYINSNINNANNTDIVNNASNANDANTANNANTETKSDNPIGSNQPDSSLEERIMHILLSEMRYIMGGNSHDNINNEANNNSINDENVNSNVALEHKNNNELKNNQTLRDIMDEVTRQHYSTPTSRNPPPIRNRHSMRNRDITDDVLERTNSMRTGRRDAINMERNNRSNIRRRLFGENGYEDVKIVLSENEYNSLTHCSFSESTHCADNENCTICLEKFMPSDDILQTTCNHVFHNNCGKQWFTHNSTKCPICRVKIGEGTPML
jgi:hypothetical protein